MTTDNTLNSLKGSGLKCRCGAEDRWYLTWEYSGEWWLSLNCRECGAVYLLEKSRKEKIPVIELVFKTES